jgi:hypothetical protein
MKNYKLSIYFVLSLLFCNTRVYSQEANLDNYISIKSQGEMPADFYLSVEEKLNQYIVENPAIKRDIRKYEFLSANYESIDDLLKSGEVTYGDPISEYVKKIANNLLIDQPEVFNKLRFYTIQSTETNALSTHQGIIFVTTGLISQLANESQLAFILAHEIAHYTQDHIMKSYEYRKTNYRKLTYSELSNHSKEHELEADKIGVELYHKAGYSYDELVNTFDILMYSYLPFDEIKVDRSFYNIPKIVFPENKFSKTEFEITAVEDYNDNLSTHPNIKKRKEETLKKAQELSGWGSNINFISNSEFITTQQICRFESLRMEIKQNNFSNALYLIFLLEKDYKNSKYLAELKTFVWYGLSNFYCNGKKSKVIPSKKNFEGESAQMHYFLNELKSDEITVLALRNIYEIYISNKEDEFITKLLTDFGSDPKIKWISILSDLKEESFQKAIENSKLNKDSLSALANIDSLKTDVKNSKYDRIKSKKSQPLNLLDSVNIFKYNFKDVLTDATFMSFFPNYKSKNTTQTPKKDSVTISTPQYKLSNRKTEISTIEKDSVLTLKNIGNLLFIDPSITSSFNNNRTEKKWARKLTQLNDEALNAVAIENSISKNTISINTILEEKSTEKFNERNLLVSLLNSAKYNSFQSLDYYELKEIKQKYNVENICFSSIRFSKDQMMISPLTYATCFFLVIPILPMLPLMIFDLATRNSTKYSIEVINLNTNQKIIEQSFYDKGKPTKLKLKNYYYQLYN